MKKILYTGLAILCSHMALGQLKVKVSGTVTGDTEGHNMVYFYNQKAKDSVEIKNGKFEFNLNEPGFDARAISLAYDQAKRRMYSPLTLFFDRSGTIEVTFDIEKGLSSSKVKGMSSAVTFFDYGQKKMEVFQAVRNKTLAKYGQDAYKKDSPVYEDAQSYSESVNVQLTDSLLNVFFEGDEMITPVLIESVTRILPTERLEYYYDKLSPKIKESEKGKLVYAKIQGMKNAYIGATVKNFELPDQHGTIQSFDQFKGKYVLLDFWASWCAPCRASFPRIREVYSKLNEKDFEIVNISIDQNKEAWEKAVVEEANPWPQLYDDRKVSYEFFNVGAVPTSYLIDPTGKIIMKEIGFDPKGGGAMEKKLEDIFNIKF